MESIKIDFDRIPEKEMHVLADTFLAACKSFYENSENLNCYNEWKAQKEIAHE